MTTENKKRAEDSLFDDLARGLAQGDISRRQALKWLGLSIAGVGLASLGFSDTAEALTARQRRKCAAKGGMILKKGTCHCAWYCVGRPYTQCMGSPDKANFICRTEPTTCYCAMTVDGEGV